MFGPKSRQTEKREELFFGIGHLIYVIVAFFDLAMARHATQKQIAAIRIIRTTTSSNAKVAQEIVNLCVCYL